jgi:hypothetical protein
MSNDDLIRRVADELEIRNLIAKIAISVDGADDLTEYASSFSEDTHWEILPERGKASQFPPVKGRANVLAAAIQRRKDGLSGPGTHAYHNIVTTAVTLRGDQATAISYFLFIKNTDVKPTLEMFRLYKDQFVRTPEGWKLSVRHIEPA